MHFDLIDLRLFLNVLESGNITAGAARSHLSLASASARIRGLETSLNIPLLERGRRGVTPTPAGKALAQHARLILQQVERMQFDLADYAKGFKGQVRLLCNSSTLSEHLPELLADFLVSHPNIDIDVEEQPSLRILHALRNGTADIGIISDAVDASDLQTRPFRADPLSLIMPLNHSLALEEHLHFSQALDYEFVGLSANSALALHLEAQALHVGKRLRIRVRAEGFDAAIRMASHGAGLSIVPQAAVQRWQGQHHFKSVPLSDAWADRQLLLCALDFDALPGYAAALLEALSMKGLSAGN
ncbi:LysR family transcriptional regulator [Pseudomonas sp. S25]|uniref:LysR family transcriptional regulator n=1 Tax=Pseudomonas maioricensis TaxID=1766623 RepID=A0ABS9ZLD0_9PSED|nr:LysR family transcriptional regulator [Pseudomonas sp. S25]MCI8210946.1 LysR family transcriptional regulator [Pseudomonas sp. S25]